MTVCRGVRGATTVEADDRDQILCATRQMLALMIRRNEIEATDVASVIFTVTHDLTAEFPALAARQLGWLEVPLLCAYELSVPDSLPRCIRMMLHWNTDKDQAEIQHIYLHEAKKLRPDLNVLPPVDFEELESWINEHISATSDQNSDGS
jgi:chorismate mutase